MDVVATLTALGGVATRSDLIGRTSRRDVDAALRAGSVVRRTRGRYALPSANEAVATAHALNGVLCLTSAALHHGWAVKQVPELAHVSVPRNRKVAPARRTGVVLHRHDLHPDDIDGAATSKEVTLLQVEPQVWIGSVRPDLVDPELRIVLEADSFEWHGDRAALRRDARRYNLLVADGWVVLRFSWEDVMFDPNYIREVLVQVVALVQRRTEVDCPHCSAA